MSRRAFHARDCTHGKLDACACAQHEHVRDQDQVMGILTQWVPGTVIRKSVADPRSEQMCAYILCTLYLCTAVACALNKHTHVWAQQMQALHNESLPEDPCRSVWRAPGSTPRFIIMRLGSWHLSGLQNYGLLLVCLYMVAKKCLGKTEFAAITQAPYGPLCSMRPHALHGTVLNMHMALS